MNRFWVTAFVLGATACSSGPVGVTGTGVAGQAAGAAGSPSRTVTSDPTNGGGKGAGSGSTLKIFFERTRVQDGAVQSVVAVSFLPERSTSSAAFGVALRVPQGFSANSIYLPGSAQVTYLRSTGIGADSLVSTSLSNWTSQPLFAFPRPVAGFALEPVHGLLAWAGQDGSLSTTVLGDATAQVQPLRLDGFRARSVSWNSAGTRLLMRTDTDAWIFSQSGSGPASQNPWQQEEVFRGVTAAVFSPEGDRLAILGHDDKILRVVRLGSGAATPPEESEHPLDSSEVYDLVWSASKGFTYWTRLTDGSQEVRTLSAGKDSAASEKTLLRLSVPSWVQGGVICPAWSQDGGALYYGDYVDGEYVIERLYSADAAKGGHPAVFAQPPAANEGFVCPKSE